MEERWTDCFGVLWRGCLGLLWREQRGEQKHVYTCHAFCLFSLLRLSPFLSSSVERWTDRLGLSWRGQTDVPKIRAHSYGLIVSAFCGGAVSAFCGGAREASKNMSTRVMPFAYFRCCGFRCFLLSSWGGNMDSSSRPLMAGPDRRAKNTRTLLCIEELVNG